MEKDVYSLNLSLAFGIFGLVEKDVYTVLIRLLPLEYYHDVFCKVLPT